ncbi:cysteine proteinase [Daldinia loculata]|uniref:cysteine proteinase n=1 Tax=Daldinia loculata TaxID=103429 RepID=UPI0020C3AA8E|nr:cysteine proteinase [Daldinia loculata]KAI1642435.1 cysteine proteinase [Daldinia loculata]KAI2782352.1 cysteine proteinase [Daldinia loculata]
MASFLNKWKTSGAAASSSAGKDGPKKKEETPLEVTPLERMLQNAGAPRQDGSDKFFGMENFGNTCYCNSIVQALYYTVPFREQVLKFPPLSPSDTPNGSRPRVNVQIRAPAVNGSAHGGANAKRGSVADAMEKRKQINSGQIQPVRPEDKPDTPEYKKKQAMLKGPILELAQESHETYGMDECTFTGLRDIFMTLVDSTVRTGVLSPQRFLEIFKRDNEMFRNSMHQDAHEFYGLVLNDIISNVESTAKRLLNQQVSYSNGSVEESLKAALGAIAKTASNGINSPGTGWVHDIFEGVLTSETKCLTCETASQRDETFLDLSIDLEEHTSVTACLQKFSAEEMLCERNKFHCDHCGGLQEAEKRMKIKRLPKVLALHLKRFKYTEDYSRLQKLFHRVVYPYHLRMFNTTEDAEDPDRLYELYAVVIHIGGNAYHGHYVSVIKTEDRGWLLFDDEMVEPVDKHYVRNFFGDKPGMACAYVLFYQETTYEKMRAEQEAEGLEEVRIASEKAGVAQEDGQPNGSVSGLSRQLTQPVRPPEDREGLTTLDHAATAPDMFIDPAAPSPALLPQLDGAVPPSPLISERTDTTKGEAKSKEERNREKKEAKAQEKARKVAEKEELKAKEKQRKEADARLREARKAEQEELKKAIEASRKMDEEEDEASRKEQDDSVPSLQKPDRGSRSMSRKSFGFLNRDKAKRDSLEVLPENKQNGESAAPSHDKPEQQFKLKKSFSFSLGRRKSHSTLS